jgi:hypothetical protein
MRIDRLVAMGAGVTARPAASGPPRPCSAVAEPCRSATSREQSWYAAVLTGPGAGMPCVPRSGLPGSFIMGKKN